MVIQLAGAKSGMTEAGVMESTVRTLYLIINVSSSNRRELCRAYQTTNDPMQSPNEDLCTVQFKA